MGRCLGRNKNFSRCNNYRPKYWLCCKIHFWQPIALILISLPAIISSYGGIYRDIIEPNTETISDHVSHNLQIQIGSSIVYNNQTEELVYRIDKNLDSITSVMSYLPIYITNLDSTKSLKDITLKINFPKNSFLGIPQSGMTKKTMGVHESNDYIRRTEEYEGIFNTYINIDRLDPNSNIFSGTFFLANKSNYF